MVDEASDSISRQLINLETIDLKLNEPYGRDEVLQHDSGNGELNQEHLPLPPPPIEIMIESAQTKDLDTNIGDQIEVGIEAPEPKLEKMSAFQKARRFFMP